MVERAIDDVPLHPATCLNTLTGIEDRAFELIWVRECGAAWRLTSEVIIYWTQSPRDGHRFVSERMKAEENGSKNVSERVGDSRGSGVPANGRSNRREVVIEQGTLPQESGACHGLQGASGSYRGDAQFVRTRIAAAGTKKAGIQSTEF
jgi:hypothetical protein